MFENLKIYFDGGSRGNPGTAGYGTVIYGVDKQTEVEKKLVQSYGHIGIATNNIAEYTGLIQGLELAKKINPKAVIQVFADSKLVVEQMSQRWKVKDEKIKQVYMKAQSYFPTQNLEFTWIPREKNKEADELANNAMDTEETNTTWYIELGDELLSNNNDTESKLVEQTQPDAQNPQTLLILVAKQNNQKHESNNETTIKEHLENENNILQTIENSIQKNMLQNENKHLLEKISTHTINNNEEKITKILGNEKETILQEYPNQTLIILAEKTVIKKILNTHIQAMLAKYEPIANTINMIIINSEGKKNTILNLGLPL